MKLNVGSRVGIREGDCRKHCPQGIDWKLSEYSAHPAGRDLDRHSIQKLLRHFRPVKMMLLDWIVTMIPIHPTFAPVEQYQQTSPLIYASAQQAQVDILSLNDDIWTNRVMCQ
jgi:hypothetical protein